MKTSKLTGPALDWAVAKAEGLEWIHYYTDELYGPLHFSTDWSEGGPIMERELLEPSFDGAEGYLWWCSGAKVTYIVKDIMEPGPTILIAAMRAYVAFKLGDEVEIPDGIV